MLNGIGSGKYITSQPFSVGGHDCAIYFYPDGKNEDENGAYVSVFIVLISDTSKDVKLFLNWFCWIRQEMRSIWCIANFKGCSQVRLTR